jgi:hypothetical protein
LAGSHGFLASVRVWLVLVAFVGVVQLFVTYVGAGLERDPRIALFTSPAVAAFGLAGLWGSGSPIWSASPSPGAAPSPIVRA